VQRVLEVGQNGPDFRVVFGNGKLSTQSTDFIFHTTHGRLLHQPTQGRTNRIDRYILTVLYIARCRNPSEVVYTGG
jgi:hypothetical protein